MDMDHNVGASGGTVPALNQQPPADAGRTKDPVCGMAVDSMTATHVHERDGARYYFCSASCHAQFAAAPAKYPNPAAAPRQSRTETIWTCPMHPQIRRSGPGACPICGMALEPVTVSLQEEENEDDGQ